jgi:hypothetical protein
MTAPLTSTSQIAEGQVWQNDRFPTDILFVTGSFELDGGNYYHVAIPFFERGITHTTIRSPRNLLKYYSLVVEEIEIE